MKIELTHYDTVISITEKSNEQSCEDMARLAFSLIVCAGWHHASLTDAFEAIAEEKREAENDSEL